MWQAIWKQVGTGEADETIRPINNIHGGSDPHHGDEMVSPDVEALLIGRRDEATCRSAPTSILAMVAPEIQLLPRPTSNSHSLSGQGRRLHYLLDQAVLPFPSSHLANSSKALTNISISPIPCRISTLLSSLFLLAVLSTFPLLPSSHPRSLVQDVVPSSSYCCDLRGCCCCSEYHCLHLVAEHCPSRPELYHHMERR